MAKAKTNIPKEVVAEIFKIAANPKRSAIPKEHPIIPSIIFPTPRPVGDLSTPSKFKANAKLMALVNNPPVVNDVATQKFDGRKVPIIIVLVRDATGLTQLGVLTRLVEGTISGTATGIGATPNGRLVDQCYTNLKGFSLLKYDRPVTDTELTALTLTIEIDGKSPTAVTFTANKFHRVLEIQLTTLPVPKFPVAATTTTPAIPLTELEKLRNRIFTFADNPLDKLPADFDPTLIKTLESLLGNNGGSDPLQQLAGSTTSDFRTRRLPIVTHFSVVRNGARPGPVDSTTITLPEADDTIKRYAVKIRQEWTFLGYTLGELAEVKSLDPGTLVSQTTNQAQHTIENISSTIDRLVSRLSEQTLSGLNSNANVTTEISTGAGAGIGIGSGIGGFIGGLFGGIGGGIFGGTGIGVGAVSNTHTSVDTSLQVNQSLRVTKDLLNENVKNVFSTLNDLKNVISSAVSQVSPILSRVTNLLRWVMYENYAVSNTIESVNEIQAIRLTSDKDLYQRPEETAENDLPLPGEVFVALFSAEDIVDHRRVFERGLLERRLAREFDVLARAIDANRRRDRIRTIRIEVNYSAVLVGADLSITIDGASPTVITLRPGTSSANGSVILDEVVTEAILENRNVSFSLTLRPDLVSFGSLTDLFPINLGRVQVLNIRLRFGGIGSNIPAQNIRPANFLVSNTAPSHDGTGINPVEIEVPDSDPEDLISLNPLFIHINKNQHHYFRLLMDAALRNPELRDDSAIVRNLFNSSHPFWRLPILGFEGHRVVLITQAAATDPNIPLLTGDGGAATIIQVAAPGHYAEALQGILQLADAAGLVHPSLMQSLTQAGASNGALNVVNNLGDGLTTGGGVSGVPIVNGNGAGTGSGSNGGGLIPLPLPSFP